MRLLALLLVLVISACAREEEVTRVRVPKEDAPAAGAALGARSGRPAETVRWSVPKGWKSLPASGMRLATMIPPGPGKAELTIVSLPGEVGGELANANRWRGQLGLGPIDERALAAGRRKTSSPAGQVAVYDFTSGDKKSRLVAGALSRGGTTWFIKLMGEEAAVAAALPGFEGLLESLHAAR